MHTAKPIHPLYGKYFTVHTNALGSFVETIRHIVERNIDGCVIIGESGVGKTFATRAVLSNTEALIGENLPCAILNSWPKSKSPQQREEVRFLKEVLKAINGYISGAHPSEIDLRDTVVDYVVQDAESNKTDKYLLFIDDAYSLEEQHYRYLMNLKSHMEERRIVFIVVLLGRPKLRKSKTSFINSGDIELTRRFMLEEDVFCGMKGQPDFTYICKAFDEYTEYPEGSGISFTQSFLPKAFKKGFRLNENGHFIWQCLVEELNKNNLSASREFMMSSVIEIFRDLFTLLRQHDCEEFEIKEEHVFPALEHFIINLLRDQSKSGRQ